MNHYHGRWFSVSLHLYLILFAVAAMLSPNSVQANICNRTHPEIQTLLRSPDARLAFRNEGGLIDGGVCWWHSRLQRSAVYLAQFSPDQPRPTHSEVKKIIQNLVQFKRVVMIPGFRNFYDFSHAYASQIQKALEQWQKKDGFVRQQWIRGLYGRSQMKASQLKNRMDWLYHRVVKSKPGVWVMAQMPGITSHSLLIVSMQPWSEGEKSGYDLQVIDSNRPLDTRELRYTRGDRKIMLGSDRFIPYLGFQQDQRKINQSINRHCSR